MTSAVRRASLDLGTNTCLMLVAEWEPAARRVDRVVADCSTIVRLGQGVDRARRLADEAMDRALDCLKRYADEAKRHGIEPSQAVAVATSQARDAANGVEFFERVRAATGFQFRTISGAEEARYTFRGGLLPGMDPARSAVIDIGGGSTELMAERSGQSVDVGSVRFTERFLKSDPVKDDEFWTCQDAIDSALGPLAGAWREVLPADCQLVGVAGTCTTLAAWHAGLVQFDAQKIDQMTLTRGDVHRLVEELKWRTVKERLALPGVDPGRADVLLAGALILWRALELLSFPDVRVSTRGLRYGILEMSA